MRIFCIDFEALLHMIAALFPAEINHCFEYLFPALGSGDMSAVFDLYIFNIAAACGKLFKAFGKNVKLMLALYVEYRQIKAFGNVRHINIAQRIQIFYIGLSSVLYCFYKLDRYSRNRGR